MKLPFTNIAFGLLLIASTAQAMEEAKLHHEYDYVVIMGALYRPVAKRINHAIKLWQQGIRFKEIVLLGSERKLDYQQEPISHFYDFNYQGPLSDIPENEHEMMQRVYETTRLPEEMEKRKTSFIKTPNLIVNGQTKWAALEDMIKHWLNHSPNPGTCLIISNQPHIDHQKSIAQRLLASFTVDATGSD